MAQPTRRLHCKPVVIYFDILVLMPKLSSRMQGCNQKLVPFGTCRHLASLMKVSKPQRWRRQFWSWDVASAAPPGAPLQAGKSLYLLGSCNLTQTTWTLGANWKCTYVEFFLAYFHTKYSKRRVVDLTDSKFVANPLRIFCSIAAISIATSKSYPKDVQQLW